MDINERAERTMFHGANLTVMEMVGDHVHLHFDDLYIDIESDDLYCANVNLAGTRQVTRNDEGVRTIQIEGEGCSVLQFRRFADRAELDLQWRYYSRGVSETCIYVFRFELFEIQIEKQN